MVRARGPTAHPPWKRAAASLLALSAFSIFTILTQRPAHTPDARASVTRSTKGSYTGGRYNASLLGA
jgi:hypothetical protein